MDAEGSGLVDIVRDFVAVHRELTRLFARYRSGELQFDEVRSLVSDRESSVLFRLKERCHALFRDGQRQSPEMRREALFDLAVGSLFHEAMKFRENLYQREVYGPKVSSLREGADPETAALFREFEKILAGAAERVDEALEETETLLAQTRDQLRLLLVAAREHGIVARYLFEHPDDIEAIFPEGLEALLERLHGDTLTARLAAVHSYLESARFDEALATVSRAAPGDEGELAHLACYAEGMRAYLAGDYGKSVDWLARWLDGAEGERACAYARFALPSVARIPGLAAGKGGPELAHDARALATRLEALVGPQEAADASSKAGTPPRER